MAIPVMLSKIFRHDCIYVRPEAGISQPADLRGERVGLPQYSSTAGVFIKGLVQHEYGVGPTEISWFMGGQDTPAPAPLVPLDLPADINLEFIPEGETLEGMLTAGELDALFATYIPNLFLNGSPKIARLFPNFKEVEQDYYRRTGIFPTCTQWPSARTYTGNAPGWRRVCSTPSQKPRNWQLTVPRTPTHWP